MARNALDCLSLTLTALYCRVLHHADCLHDGLAKRTQFCPMKTDRLVIVGRDFVLGNRCILVKLILEAFRSNLSVFKFFCDYRMATGPRSEAIGVLLRFSLRMPQRNHGNIVN